MPFAILLSFFGEGNTDDRFLRNIAERLIENLLLTSNIEATIQWQTVQKKGDTLADKILNAAKQTKHCTTLIIHTDADDQNIDEATKYRIMPGCQLIQKYQDNEVCKNYTIVIPITETEAWMLVDKELLKEEMNTNLSNNQLQLIYPLNRIEKISDPKQTLINAIQIHHQGLPPKRRRSAVKISELYEPISSRIELSKLEALSAYVDFKNNLIAALRNKNIIP